MRCTVYNVRPLCNAMYAHSVHCTLHYTLHCDILYTQPGLMFYSNNANFRWIRCRGIRSGRYLTPLPKCYVTQLSEQDDLVSGDPDTRLPRFRKKCFRLRVLRVVRLNPLFISANTSSSRCRRIQNDLLLRNKTKRLIPSAKCKCVFFHIKCYIIRDKALSQASERVINSYSIVNHLTMN